ncbi:ATP synthase F0 subunit A [Candidatus Kuenenbacteria bacterium RIFCSPHIGHO2_12_FULL_42_14]|uniref:ATP synthase subunit a n=2 Tax=Candidatus Kueneniibacteriota TaxID=1752740 RepID=A0A0G0YX55_9BACT|nr:MAG: ATP synthase subunit a [Candidatus Kuenenbacteria bacterium GW2011_GWA2_42_15]OGH00633.1 MAG: ATP synthase F0 subunit A [Candidatus Kuenenbacteria bacterium RIFCSPHIGHO2_12_FULL_42_14]
MYLSLAAEPVFHIAGLPVTNSIINTWIAVLAFVFFAAAIKIKGIALVPRGVQNFSEYLIETIFGYIDGVTHNRRKSEKFLPIIATIFIFILVLNWMGQLPGTGSIGLWEVKAGERRLVPFLRPGTSDLNTTLALAVFAVAATHIFGMATVGIFKHLNKFFNFGGLIRAVKTFNPLKIFTAMINFFIGLIEIFSEIAKTVSLSLRLFGNVFAGEVLLTVMASLIAYLVPIPFMFLELLVGIVQATIFAMLTLVFMEVATHGEH